MNPQFLEAFLDVVPFMIGPVGEVLEDSGADNEYALWYDMDSCTHVVDDDVAGCQAGP